MEKPLKIKLLLYLLVSAFSFTYLILPENAGISITIWAIIQFTCLYYIFPKHKALLFFVPIFILSLNSFISANSMWRISNFVVIVILYSVMCLIIVDRFPLNAMSYKFLANTLENIFMPLEHFLLPFKWCSEANKEHAKIVKRILIAVGITLPCLLIVTIFLSLADSIFSNDMDNFLQYSFKFININMSFKVIYGILVGLYLFGMVYITYAPRKEEKAFEKKFKDGDLIVLNILLISILSIYTMFVIIQFRYLFAGSTLPYGLTFTEYARKGFFELLFLSGLNILLILITVNLTHEKQGLWSKITKGLCSYLCLVTIIMLTSSFYRMWLYNVDDGLTRLRFLVFGFLIFESIGLIITFFYIIKPKFNIVAVYLSIAILYYTILNIVPIDSIVAKNQIDLYLNNTNVGIDYILTLSPDASKQIERLKYDKTYGVKVNYYFENLDKYYNSVPFRWQRFNLSLNQAFRIVEK